MHNGKTVFVRCFIFAASRQIKTKPCLQHLHQRQLGELNGGPYQFKINLPLREVEIDINLIYIHSNEIHNVAALIVY